MTTYGHYIQDLDYKPETKKKKKRKEFFELTSLAKKSNKRKQSLN